MALPGPEVLQDLNEMITTITGFKETEENFGACKKYCLSHFVHHTYPSVSKSAVQTIVDQFVTRFYIQGKFQLSRALRTQADHFLRREETFKANPECQIEWNLLSLVTSLTSNLSEIQDVPGLLPLDDVNEAVDNFDWASYLNKGMPVCRYDMDSDSFSSLSSESSHELSSHFETTQNLAPTENVTHVVEPAPPTGIFEIPILSKAGKIYSQKLVERNKENWVEEDVTKKGGFVFRWSDLCRKRGIDPGPYWLISEKEAVENIIHCLMTGDNLDSFHGSTVSSLAKETFQGYINTLRPYTEAVKSFNEFIAANKPLALSCETSVVAKNYASCLRQVLLPYELKIYDIGLGNLSLLRLQKELRPCLPFIQGLWSIHRLCIAHWGKEPSWKTSLRIIAVLYNAMTSYYRADLRSAFLFMFLNCHVVYGEIMDGLLTTSDAVDSSNEFFIQREVSADGTKCSHIARDFHQVPDLYPLVEFLAKKISESSLSLSLLYLMNRFRHLRDLPSINQSLFKTLKLEFGDEENNDDREEPTNVLLEMSNLFTFSSSNGKSFCAEKSRIQHQDFLQVARWVVNSDSCKIVHKVIEKAVAKAVTEQLDAVTRLALTILVEEMSIERHLAMLRSVWLHHDASLLLPFTQVFFNEERCWNNSEYLTLLLRECVAVSYPDFAGNVSVKLEPSEGIDYRNVIEAIDCIRVIYQVVYPVSLIITPDALDRYNAMFRAILKLKWALTLSHLPFPAKGPEMSAAERYVAHRLQILRFSILADLNVINNYFMAQVTATLPLMCHHFTDVQTLITEHEAMVDKMHTRCMLFEGGHYLQIFDAITPLCFDLRRCWLFKVTNIVSMIKNMEYTNRGTHARLRRLMDFYLNGKLTYLQSSN